MIFFLLLMTTGAIHVYLADSTLRLIIGFIEVAIGIFGASFCYVRLLEKLKAATELAERLKDYEIKPFHAYFGGVKHEILTFQRTSQIPHHPNCRCSMEICYEDKCEEGEEDDLPEMQE